MFEMAFQPPTGRQELQNRKILEELQQQKKQLLSKQAQAPASTTGLPLNSIIPPSTVNLSDAHALTVSQRTALQHAHAHSVGFFITQDSSFGNLILPVLPRLENTKQ